MKAKFICILTACLASSLSMGQVWLNIGANAISTYGGNAILVTDSNENLYVGYEVNNASHDVVVRKYSSSGTYLASQTIGGTHHEYLVDMVCRDDKIYVLATDKPTGGDYDSALIARMDTNLSVEWTQWDAVANKKLILKRLLVKDDGSKFYIVGSAVTPYVKSWIYYARFTSSTGAKDYGQEYSLGADSLGKTASYCSDALYDACLTSTDGITALTGSSFPTLGNNNIKSHASVIRLGDAPWNAWAWYYIADCIPRGLTNNGNSFTLIALENAISRVHFVGLDASLGVTSTFQRDNRDYTVFARGFINSTDVEYGIGQIASGTVAYGPSPSVTLTNPTLYPGPTPGQPIVANNCFYYSAGENTPNGYFRYNKYSSTGSLTTIQIADGGSTEYSFIKQFAVTASGKLFAISRIGGTALLATMRLE